MSEIRDNNSLKHKAALTVSVRPDDKLITAMSHPTLQHDDLFPGASGLYYVTDPGEEAQ